MSTCRPSSSPAPRRESKSRTALIAAYREGLALAAVAVIHGAAGVRIVAASAVEPVLAPGETIEQRWWCRRTADAERVAAAATLRWRCRESHDGAPAQRAGSASGGSPVGKIITAAAKRLCVALYGEAEICSQAMNIIARVDAQFESLQQAGELKSINQAYRAYRTDCSRRGEKVIRYADWVDKYKENLVRQLAAALRYS